MTEPDNRDRPSQGDAPLVDAAEQDPDIHEPGAAGAVEPAPADPQDEAVDPDEPLNPA